MQTSLYTTEYFLKTQDFENLFVHNQWRIMMHKENTYIH